MPNVSPRFPAKPQFGNYCISISPTFKATINKIPPTTASYTAFMCDYERNVLTPLQPPIPCYTSPNLVHKHLKETISNWNGILLVLPRPTIVTLAPFTVAVKYKRSSLPFSLSRSRAEVTVLQRINAETGRRESLDISMLPILHLHFLTNFIFYYFPSSFSYF
jgi:hypothetical protein